MIFSFHFVNFGENVDSSTNVTPCELFLLFSLSTILSTSATEDELPERRDIFMTLNCSKKRITTSRTYLIKVRDIHHMTQKDVATKMGVEIHVYNEIENGKRGTLMNARKLYLLAKAFNLDCETLLTNEIAFLDEVDALNSKKTE